MNDPVEPGTETVLVGGVLHWTADSHRENVLPIYLAHLRAMEVPPRYARMYGFVLDGCPPMVEIQMLRLLEAPCSFLRVSLWEPDHMPEERGKRKRLDTFGHMAFVRNLLADMALRLNCSHLLSVDGDIALHSSSLGVLLGLARPQASVLIQNTPPPEEPWAWNILAFTMDGLRCTHIEPHAAGGLCDVTGAACLYDRDTLEHVRFWPDPQGEDIGFGRAARLRYGPPPCAFKAAYVPCGAEHLMVPEQVGPHLLSCAICRREGGVSRKELAEVIPFRPRQETSKTS